MLIFKRKVSLAMAGFLQALFYQSPAINRVNNAHVNKDFSVKLPVGRNLSCMYTILSVQADHEF